MKCILGRKVRMTQVFRNDGSVVPVTLVQAGPCVVTATRTVERDGYHAVQLGFGTAKHVAKAQKGAWGELGSFSTVREFRVDDSSSWTIGDKVDVSAFSVGDKIVVIGQSKGHGFQGVVKRHGFHGQDSTHGTKDQERMPGSLGAGGVQRVFKGMRMGGRMGNAQVTVKNLEVVEVRAEEGLLAIKGALPGSRNSILELHTV